jgi:methionyl-tRNA formyltransferase
VTQPDRQSGRGRHVTFCPVKTETQKHGLRILQPDKVRDTAFIKDLRLLNPSVIVVAAYGQILPLDIINMPEYGCVNVHASLLPKYRGAAPINWAIINGESKTGITIMLMDEGMDTGHILFQEEVVIYEGDTAGSLSHRLSGIGADVLMKALKGLEEGSLKPRQQDGIVSYAPLLSKTDGLIKWANSAKKLSNFIRGMNPWPGAYSFLENERIKILRAETVEGVGSTGVIRNVTKNKLLVGTDAGLLSILEVQPTGKQVMPVDSFLQGRKIKEGMRFHENTVN